MTSSGDLLLVLFAGLAIVGIIVGAAGWSLSRSLRITVEGLRGELAASLEDKARLEGENTRLRTEDAGKGRQIDTLTAALATGPDMQVLVDQIRAMAQAVIDAVSHRHS